MKSAALIFGWIFTILGGFFAAIFGLLTLFLFGRGPYGIIIAIYMAGPLCLFGIAALALGHFLKNRAQRKTTVDNSKSTSFPRSAIHSQPTGETVMTNQTNHPADSPKRLNDTHRSAYNPITLEDVQNTETEPLFAGLDNPSTRVLGAILFIVILVLSNASAPMTPVILVILLACLLYRMNAWERSVAAVPLTFSSVRLASGLAGPLGLWGQFVSFAPTGSSFAVEKGLTWIPLFFSACLFFIPSRRTHTSRVVFWYSFALLLSGLLPGMGYLFIAGLLYYTLFVAIFVAIFIALLLDLQPQLAVPRPLAPSPQPARA